jgi:hypothetical protein
VEDVLETAETVLGPLLAVAVTAVAVLLFYRALKSGLP